MSAHPKLAVVALATLGSSIALASCGQGAFTPPTTSNSISLVRTPAPKCYTGGYARAVVTPSTAQPGQLVTFKIVGEEPWLDLVTGIAGTFAQNRGGRWKDLYALFVGRNSVGPSYQSEPVNGAVIELGGLGPLALKIPPVAPGSYSIQFEYRTVPGRSGPLPAGSYLFCGTVQTRSGTAIAAKPAVLSCTSYVPADRPKAMFIGGCATSNIYLDNFTWQTWSPTEATAVAIEHENDCAPSCAQGIYATFPVKVTLSDPGYVRGGLVFQKLSATPTSDIGSPMTETAPGGTWGWVQR